MQIALTLAAHLAPQLATTPHGAVTLSEHDLTVLAQQHNPHPDRYSNLAVRVRDRLLVISANDHYGPFTVTPVPARSFAMIAEKASRAAFDGP